MKLNLDFYSRRNVLRIAKDLLGKELVTRIDGKLTSGIIVETEAYNGISDRASHAFGGRRTPRTEIMYREGGCAYVYLCYGMYHLFNVVTGVEDVPQAVLIRSVIPERGVAHMEKRRKLKRPLQQLCAGPGTTSIALGINTDHTGISLLGNKIWIEDAGVRIPDRHIIKSPRVGVAYAGADALLPWRFRANI